MLRTIFTIGLFALLGVFALNILFGVMGFLFALLKVFLVWAVQIAIVGLVIYLIIRIVSPDTARKMRERWSGSSM